MAKPLLCLAMIVKDESEGISRSLASVAPFVDRWVIADTGSSDDTKQKVSHALRDVPGALHDIPFEDFSTTRNKVMDLCGQDCEFILWLDSDEAVSGGAALRTYLQSRSDGVAWWMRLRRGKPYDGVRLVRSSARWRYVGDIHEALAPPPGDGARPQERVPGVEIVHEVAPISAERSRQRWQRDLQLLEARLRKDPQDTRAAFYLASTLMWLGRDAQAAIAFRRRIAMGGWGEEVYHSKMNLVALEQRRGRPWGEIMDHLLEAHELAPHRAEPLYALAMQYYQFKQNALTLLFARRGYELPFPSQDHLFVDDEVYTWKLADLVASSAYWVGEFTLGEEAARVAVKHRPDDARLQKNLQVYLDRPGAKRTDSDDASLKR